MSSRILGAAWFALTLMSSVIAASFADAGSKTVANSAPDVLVLVDPLDTGAQPFEPVIAAASQYKLENVGFDVQTDFVPAGQDAQPLSQASAAGATAVILCSYGLEGRQITLKLGWYDTGAQAAEGSIGAAGSALVRLCGDPAEQAPQFDLNEWVAIDRIRKLGVNDSVGGPGALFGCVDFFRRRA